MRDLIKQWKRSEFDVAFAELRALGMVTEEHRAEFDQNIQSLNPDKVSFAPGITLQWQLPLDKAARLDQQGQLETKLRAAIEQGAKALQLRLPWDGGESPRR